MGIRTDISKLAKLTRESLLLEAVREFPDLTEEELIEVLESWRILRNRTEEELKTYAQTGSWVNPAGQVNEH